MELVTLLYFFVDIIFVKRIFSEFVCFLRTSNNNLIQNRKTKNNMLSTVVAPVIARRTLSNVLLPSLARTGMPSVAYSIPLAKSASAPCLNTAMLEQAFASLATMRKFDVGAIRMFSTTANTDGKQFSFFTLFIFIRFLLEFLCFIASLKRL